MMFSGRQWSTVVLALCCLISGKALATSLLLLSTTSTENSGLLAAILPQFTRDSGIDVKVLALGTGQAMRAAQNGDGDLLLVHDAPSEEAFVAQGYGRERIPLMYNDFILVGPKTDPAGTRQQKDVLAALRALAQSAATFVSRGDASGTYKAEQRLWQAAKVQPQKLPPQRYREVGSGMGRTLTIAASLNAYTLVDRGTWLSFHNKQQLEVLLEGDPRLFNQYSLITLEPSRYPHLQHQAADALVDWLISSRGQQAVASFAIDGQPLFFPNYLKMRHQQRHRPTDYRQSRLPN